MRLKSAWGQELCHVLLLPCRDPGLLACQDYVEYPDGFHREIYTESKEIWSVKVRGTIVKNPVK
jgi:hypothetical protein